MREFYFTTEFDLGSSGVQCWSLAQLRRLLAIDMDDLDDIYFDDSQSLGGRVLRGALARRFTAGNTERVAATHGSTEAIFLVMNALLSAGDEVVVVDPGYHSLWSIAESIGCRLIRWRLRATDGFVPDLDALRALMTPRTRMVVVNFPNNPTGASLAHARFDEFVDVVAGSGAYLVWDGAFTELTYDSPPLPDPAERYERCITLGTLSKVYGLPGTRIGWCIGDPRLLAQLLPIRDVLTICLSPLIEFIAARVIDGADRILSLRGAQARQNLDHLNAWAAANTHLVDWIAPIGGCTGFPRIVGHHNTEHLCRRLGNDENVLLIPGSCFGHPDRVRLGFGGDPAAFAEGLERLERTLHSYHTTNTSGPTTGSRVAP